MSKKYSLRELEVMADEIATEITKDSYLSGVFMSALNKVAEIKVITKSVDTKIAVDNPDTLEIMADSLDKEAFELPKIRLPKGVNWGGVASDALGDGLDTALKIKSRRDSQDPVMNNRIPAARIKDQNKLLGDFATQMTMKSKIASDVTDEEKLAFRPSFRRAEESPEDKGKNVLRGALVGVGMGLGAGALLSKGKGLLALKRSSEVALKETKPLRDFGSTLADKYKSIHLDDAEYVSGLFKEIKDPAVRTNYERIFGDVKNTARELKGKVSRSPGTGMDPALYDEIVGHYAKHVEPSGMPQPAKDELKKYIDDTFQVRRRGPGPGDSGPPRGGGGPEGDAGGGGSRQQRPGGPKRSSQFAERLNATLNDQNTSAFPSDFGALLERSPHHPEDYATNMVNEYKKHYGKIKNT